MLTQSLSSPTVIAIVVEVTGHPFMVLSIPYPEKAVVMAETKDPVCEHSESPSLLQVRAGEQRPFQEYNSKWNKHCLSFGVLYLISQCIVAFMLCIYICK